MTFGEYANNAFRLIKGEHGNRIDVLVVKKLNKNRIEIEVRK